MNALRVLLFAVIVTGCNCGVGISGSGVSKTETRDLDKQYHRVEVSGGLEVKLTDRAPETLSITTDDNLVARIITVIGDDGALRIGVAQNANLFPQTGLT